MSTKPTVAASASVRPTSQPLGAGRATSPTRGTGDESPASTGLAEHDLLMAGILLFTFCSAGAAALYAFGRRQSSHPVPFAAIAAATAAPVVPLPAREDWTSDSDYEAEAGVPRWLRASVRAERFWTPQPRRPERELYERPAVAFAQAPANAAKMVVRDDVSLLDGPNESYAAIVGRLQSGDEVLVVLMDRDWAEVRTSRGAGGWLPSTALAATEGAAPAPPELVEAGRPEPAAPPVKRARSRPTRKRRAAPS